MEKFCDLHTHSLYSDGTASPAELVREAKKEGLSAVALTDHNTVAGLSEFTAAAKEQGIEGVCGIEFSADFESREIHILGLFIKEEYFGDINELLADVKRRKEEANRALATALRDDGFDISYDEIKNASGGYVNRAHFATALFEKGYAESVRNAFDKYLTVEAGYYKEPGRLSAFEVIPFICRIGAVPVLAHPFLNLSESELRRFLPVARGLGLSAMETDYSEYSEDTTFLARGIADEYGILRSGGSDWHGKRKPLIRMGRGKGDLRVPYEYLSELKKEAK